MDQVTGADLALDLARDCQRRLETLISHQHDDPFANPVLSMALQFSREIEDGTIDEATLEGLVRTLRDEAFVRRGARIAAYVGLEADGSPDVRFGAIAERLVRPDPNDSPVPLARFRDSIERTRFAAVFTAHPTFAMPAPLYVELARIATGDVPGPGVASHRPKPITLAEEFAQATDAIARGRDALDRLTLALLEVARAIWPGQWRTLRPRPVILASWVGYDTDGRNDIDWHDTLRLRLVMKRLQLERLARQAGAIEAAEALRARLEQAAGAVGRQIEVCRGAAEPEGAAALARVLIDERDTAILHIEALDGLFDAAAKAAPADAQVRLAVMRSGLTSHGLGLAHTHTRLNATQVHNVARQRLGITDSPQDASQRRALLVQINEALDAVEPVPVDFGAILAERASAAKLMMTVAQIIKHVDASTPVRFLIAETETGYTLLVALWLARRFGVEERIEISPLFETAEALERGSRVVEEALRSPHYVAYLQRIGRLSLQFGYSDSGRYVGQMAATYQIERLRLKIAELMVKRGLVGIEVVLFDTHGESIGRGAHPGSLADRLAYLSPDESRRAFARAGIAVREESAFQGGDGYLLFGTAPLAEATIAAIATHAFGTPAEEDDPIYDDPDFSADFFAGIGVAVEELVEDRGYAALLGAFGPALIDKTGSRPAARQTDAGGMAAIIKHPRELRAIPNNAILQQLGWCANTLQGVGRAVARHPEAFERLLADSRRFRRALDFVRHGLAHSDRDVLHATIVLLDPGTWLDRAVQADDAGARHDLESVALGLERLRLWAVTRAMAHRIDKDALLLRAAWPEAPTMAPCERLLHAVRLALIARIWTLAARIPYFAPRGGMTRETLEDRVLRLDVPAALVELAETFPRAAELSSAIDFGEPHGPGTGDAYAREHETIFEPMARAFALVREIGTAVMHEVGAFG